MKRLMMTVVLAAALTACGKKKEAAPAAGSGSGTAVVDTAADAADPVAPVDPDAAEPAAAVEVPTEADFEEEVAAKVTDKTLETDLTALEKELGN